MSGASPPASRATLPLELELELELFAPEELDDDVVWPLEVDDVSPDEQPTKDEESVARAIARAARKA